MPHPDINVRIDSCSEAPQAARIDRPEGCFPDKQIHNRTNCTRYAWKERTHPPAVLLAGLDTALTGTTGGEEMRGPYLRDRHFGSTTFGVTLRHLIAPIGQPD